QDALVTKPASLTFEQAAVVPSSSFTALQGLRDHGKVQRGQKVLINGASGGVGTFAVQIAKSFGADVTGVCSTRNVDLVRTIGADHVIDYTREDYTKSDERYDVILDIAANHSLSKCRGVLAPRGTYVLIGDSGGRWLGGLSRFIKTSVLSPFVSQRMRAFVSKPSKADLLALKELLEVPPRQDS
ncbi:MAG: NAD(P)-dependent alcohol dehydrogenase, partial [Deltaproteobacteria bacterium]|nr:NAD(P)-dependent alcohol dehydrogenase [Deltaproteobacteria bacterium]